MWSLAQYAVTLELETGQMKAAVNGMTPGNCTPPCTCAKSAIDGVIVQLCCQWRNGPFHLDLHQPIDVSCLAGVEAEESAHECSH